MQQRFETLFRINTPERAIAYIRETLGDQLPKKETFYRFSPQRAWLDNPDADLEEHNIDHHGRVMVHSLLLARLRQHHYECLILNEDALLLSGATHDVRRNAKDHGAVAAEWVRVQFQGKIPQATLGMAMYLNTNHYVPRSSLENIPEELRILKDADSAEKLRVQKGFYQTEDPIRLSTPEAQQIFPHIAPLLYGMSVKGSFEDVLRSARMLGLMQI